MFKVYSISKSDQKFQIFELYDQIFAHARIEKNYSKFLRYF